MENKKERFSIRKFSVGAASVLIGFTIFGLGTNSQSVKADTINPNQVNINTTNTTKEKVLDSVQNKVNDKNTESTNAQTAQVTTAPKETQAKVDNLVQTTKPSENVQASAANQNKQEKPAVQNKAAENNQSQSVSDYSQFLNALQDANVNTIKLSQNIDFNNANLNNTTYQNLNNYGSVLLTGKNNMV